MKNINIPNKRIREINWMAQDSHGYWYGYVNKPYISFEHGYFYSKEGCISIGKNSNSIGWENTLMRVKGWK